jgi:glutathione S-transferase
VRESHPTFADFMVFDTISAVLPLDPAALAKAPLVGQFLKRMAARPGIKNYHDKRLGPQNRNGKTAFFDNAGAV